MSIGQRMGNLKTLKQSLQKGGGGGAWIKYIPKNGSMNVRFIQEPEEWVNYVEHYDATLRRSYPCNGEANCPGCTTGERKSNRYLANVVDVDNDRVIPLQMPKDLANRLVARYERNGTMIDRDYELSRSGEGIETVYDLDVGVVDRKKIAKYVPVDLLKVLQDAYNEVFGGGSDDDDDEPAKVTRTRTRTASARKALVETLAEDEDQDAGDEAPVVKKPAAKKAAAKKSAAVPEPKFTPDVDDDDEEDEDEDDEPDEDEEDEDEDEAYDEETLKALPLGALRAVARDFGVEVAGKKASTIIAEIMTSGDPVEDDDAEEKIPF